jgi:hypothetical protein
LANITPNCRFQKYIPWQTHCLTHTLLRYMPRMPVPPLRRYTFRAARAFCTAPALDVQVKSFQDFFN